MNEPIRVRVEAAPPAKDPGFSIRNPQHPNALLVEALREAMRRAMAGREPLEGVPARLEMRLFRAACRADALNLINGIADVIQRRCHSLEHACDVWLIDDDANIREFHYTEEPAGRDAYEITLRRIEGRGA